MVHHSSSSLNSKDKDIDNIAVQLMITQTKTREKIFWYDAVVSALQGSGAKTQRRGGSC
jgi:hypothetical protein